MDFPNPNFLPLFVPVLEAEKGLEGLQRCWGWEQDTDSCPLDKC